MAETQKGGIYKVGDKFVNAHGEEVKPTAQASTEPPKADTPPVVYVEGLTFGSDAAGQAAKEAGLTADDFKGYTPSGVEGYTKPDVLKVIASRSLQSS